MYVMIAKTRLGSWGLLLGPERIHSTSLGILNFLLICLMASGFKEVERSWQEKISPKEGTGIGWKTTSCVWVTKSCSLSWLSSKVTKLGSYWPMVEKLSPYLHYGLQIRLHYLNHRHLKTDYIFLSKKKKKKDRLYSAWESLLNPWPPLRFPSSLNIWKTKIWSMLRTFYL